jgi:hypothetical protein
MLNRFDPVARHQFSSLLEEFKPKGCGLGFPIGPSAARNSKSTVSAFE